jgi:hypothetical protein
MGALTQVLINSPGWFSSILVLLTLGGAGGMFAMMKITTTRIKCVEEQCKKRVEYCGHIFQSAGEATIRYETIDGRLVRIENKLDSIIMKNGWT